MSSQPAGTMTVPPPPAPRPVRRRSLAGPIVLIAIGVVFLLGNFGLLTWHRIGLLFANFWPVLIILWGVVKLVEHYEARRGGYAASGIGAGGVLLLVLLVVFGLAASQARRVDWGQLSQEWDLEGNVPMFGMGQSFPFTDELQQEFPAGSSLRVASDRGNISVVAWDEPRIKVSVEKRVYTESESDAKRVDAATKPTIIAAGGLVTVNANTGGAGGKTRVASDLTIYLPRKAAVDATTAHGNVEVRGRDGAVQIGGSHGEVTVGDITGNASLRVRDASVRVTDVRGDVVIDGAVKEATITDIGGGVRLNGGSYDTLSLSRIKGQTYYQSSRTEIELARLDGSLTLEQGDLHANSLAGPSKIITRSKDIRLDDIAGDLKIEDTNGDIQLQATKVPLGNIQVNGRRGDVKLSLPGQANFNLDASTVRGDISTDFSQLSVTSKNSRSTVNGAVGSGGPHVQINLEHGDIEVRKG